MFKRKAVIIVSVVMSLLALAAIAYAQDKPVEAKLLANGMTVFFQEGMDEPASVCLFVKAGPASETNGSYGITRLLNSVLLSIDPLVNSNPPMMRIEQAGAIVSVETSAEYSCFKLAVPSRNLPAALKALGEVFNGRSFSEASTTREKEAIASHRLRAEDRIEERVVRSYLENTMAGSRYLFITEGDTGTVSGLGAKQLNAWYNANYQPGNMVLSICGKLNPASAFKLAETSFNGIAAGKTTSGRVTSVPAAGAVRIDVESSPGLSAVLFGYEAPPEGSLDYTAVAVAESLLACGMGSSMFRKLRDDSVIAYEFGKWMPATSGPSRLALYAVPEEGAGEQVGVKLRECIDELKTGAFSNDDFIRAKSLLIGRASAKKESNFGKAWTAGFYEVMGLGQDHGANLEKQVGKLDKDELVRVSGRYFDRCSEVVLKPRSTSY